MKKAKEDYNSEDKLPPLMNNPQITTHNVVNNNKYSLNCNKEMLRMSINNIDNHTSDKNTMVQTTKFNKFPRPCKLESEKFDKMQNLTCKALHNFTPITLKYQNQPSHFKIINRKLRGNKLRVAHNKTHVTPLLGTIGIQKWGGINNFTINHKNSKQQVQTYHNEDNQMTSMKCVLNKSFANKTQLGLDSSTLDPNKSAALVKRKAQGLYSEEKNKKLKISNSEENRISPILGCALKGDEVVNDSSPVIGANTISKIDILKTGLNTACDRFKYVDDHNKKIIKSFPQLGFEKDCRSLKSKLKPISVGNNQLQPSASNVELSPVLSFNNNNKSSVFPKKYNQIVANVSGESNCRKSSSRIRRSTNNFAVSRSSCKISTSFPSTTTNTVLPVRYSNKKVNKFIENNCIIANDVELTGCYKQRKYIHTANSHCTIRKPLRNLLHDFTYIENVMKNHTTYTPESNIYCLKHLPCFNQRAKYDSSFTQIKKRTIPNEELESNSLLHVREDFIKYTPIKSSTEIQSISPVLNSSVYQKSSWNALIAQNSQLNISERMDQNETSFIINNTKKTHKIESFNNLCEIDFSDQILPHSKLVENCNVLKENRQFNCMGHSFNSDEVDEGIQKLFCSFNNCLNGTMNLEPRAVDLNLALSFKLKGEIKTCNSSENKPSSILPKASLSNSSKCIESINVGSRNDCNTTIPDSEPKISHSSRGTPEVFLSNFVDTTSGKVKTSSNNNNMCYLEETLNVRKSIRKALFSKNKNKNHEQIEDSCNHSVEDVNDLSGIEQLDELHNTKVIKSNTSNGHYETNALIEDEKHNNSDVGFIIENSDSESVDNIEDNLFCGNMKENLCNNFYKMVPKSSKSKHFSNANSLCFKPQVQNVSEFLDNCLGASAIKSKSNHNIEFPVSPQENILSPEFIIEYPSPITNMSQEMCCPSYPPAINLLKDKEMEPENIDSASKNRIPRIKKGSYVERLRRLLRAERAEVNMFNHEGPPHHTTHSFVLKVDSVVKTCSTLLLTCHHANRHHSSSEDFSSEDGVLDAVVHVCVAPIHAKNVVTGCTIFIYPPWYSLWSDNKGILTLYATTKLLVNSSPSDLAYLPQRTEIISSHQLHQFSCRFEEDNCSCHMKLIEEVFNQKREVSRQQVMKDGSVKAALNCGLYTHCFQLRLTILHSFHRRNQKVELLPGFICLDTNNVLCQLNFQSPADGQKLQNMIQESKSNTFEIKNVTYSKLLYIDRCRGLRSMVSQLYKDSSDQHLMYVVTPSSSEWTVQPLCPVPESSYLPRKDLNLHNLQVEVHEVRVNANFIVLALRKDMLYGFNQELDTYFKINISSSAVMPTVYSRNVLHIQYLCFLAGAMKLDKFSIVTVVDQVSTDFPLLQSLSIQSVEGDLVTLDSVVTRASSGVSLRWEGDCGHSLHKPRFSSHYYCTICKETVINCHQRISMEVCVDSNLGCSIRVKVKNETAQVFLLGKTGHVSPDKSYNLISMIGARLKCLAVVLEVLNDPSGNVLELLLEEV